MSTCSLWKAARGICRGAPDLDGICSVELTERNCASVLHHLVLNRHVYVFFPAGRFTWTIMQPPPLSQKSSRPWPRPWGKPGEIPAVLTQQVILEGAHRSGDMGGRGSQRNRTPHVITWFWIDFLLTANLRCNFWLVGFQRSRNLSLSLLVP